MTFTTLLNYTIAKRLCGFALISLSLLCAHSPKADALPQFTLLTGNKCLNCHISTQGGGLRNDLGWYMAKDMKLFSAHSVGLEFIEKAESNSLADGALIFGFDARLQMTRSPRTVNAETRFIPMQTAVYGAWIAAPWLTLEGMVDVGALARQASGAGLPFAGQQAWSASAMIQPSLALPQLRIGHFQPSIGIRYDDHTMLVRQVAGANTIPIIAPNFAEYGAELNYDGLQWLSLSAGAYLPRSLAQIRTINKYGESVPLLGDSLASAATASNLGTLAASPSYLARFAISPRTDDHVFNSYFGASYFINRSFSMVNIFAGVGLSDRAALQGEYVLSGISEGRQTRNYSVMFTYQALSGLLPFVRFERGITQVSAPNATNGIAELYSVQATIGAQIFPLPFIELRPEFRYYDTESFRSTRWNLQLHLYY
ncbi:MAG: hypothetical protein JNN25_03880 [Candidatus Kapabacteria bacterium]|nr:hypothetical protein [Candidatus Kapabacteria bacterium]